ncbi:MAG: THUMP domain-containing protein [Candidatus Methanomethyliaceae archaeon]|nr:THUMP domain-containing protein [Candidatus Methanomethyliaceae archaeon]MCX8170227.1 THUMP domain-containing protein [Candidatus Methanomethyliaceae archaeon]MDW7971210.1 THUMP domain-containing protein [Nitrososphaerota archaeon]
MGILIVTVPCGKEKSAKLEILDCLFPKDHEAYFIEHKYSGILILESKLSSDELARLILNCPTAYVHKVIPVDAIVNSNLDSIIEKIKELVKNKKGKIRVDCRRRGRSIQSSHEVEVVVGRVLKELGYTIDLKKPEYLAIINIIDEWTAISFGPMERFIDKRAYNGLQKS